MIITRGTSQGASSTSSKKKKFQADEMQAVAAGTAVSNDGQVGQSENLHAASDASTSGGGTHAPTKAFKSSSVTSMSPLVIYSSPVDTLPVVVTKIKKKKQKQRTAAAAAKSPPSTSTRKALPTHDELLPVPDPSPSSSPEIGAKPSRSRRKMLNQPPVHSSSSSSSSSSPFSYTGPCPPPPTPSSPGGDVAQQSQQDTGPTAGETAVALSAMPDALVQAVVRYFGSTTTTTTTAAAPAPAAAFTSTGTGTATSTKKIHDRSPEEQLSSDVTTTTAMDHHHTKISSSSSTAVVVTRSRRSPRSNSGITDSGSNNDNNSSSDGGSRSTTVDGILPTLTEMTTTTTTTRRTSRNNNDTDQAAAHDGGVVEPTTAMVVLTKKLTPTPLASSPRRRQLSPRAAASQLKVDAILEDDQSDQQQQQQQQEQQGRDDDDTALTVEMMTNTTSIDSGNIGSSSSSSSNNNNNSDFQSSPAYLREVEMQHLDACMDGKTNTNPTTTTMTSTSGSSQNQEIHMDEMIVQQFRDASGQIVIRDGVDSSGGGVSDGIMTKHIFTYQESLDTVFRSMNRKTAAFKDTGQTPHPQQEQQQKQEQHQQPPPLTQKKFETIVSSQQQESLVTPSLLLQEQQQKQEHQQQQPSSLTKKKRKMMTSSPQHEPLRSECIDSTTEKKLKTNEGSNSARPVTVAITSDGNIPQAPPGTTWYAKKSGTKVNSGGCGASTGNGSNETTTTVATTAMPRLSSTNTAVAPVTTPKVNLLTALDAVATIASSNASSKTNGKSNAAARVSVADAAAANVNFSPGGAIVANRMMTNESVPFFPIPTIPGTTATGSGGGGICLCTYCVGDQVVAATGQGGIGHKNNSKLQLQDSQQHQQQESRINEIRPSRPGMGDPQAYGFNPYFNYNNFGMANLEHNLPESCLGDDLSGSAGFLEWLQNGADSFDGPLDMDEFFEKSYFNVDKSRSKTGNEGLMSWETIDWDGYSTPTKASARQALKAGKELLFSSSPIMDGWATRRLSNNNYLALPTVAQNGPTGDRMRRSLLTKPLTALNTSFTLYPSSYGAKNASRRVSGVDEKGSAAKTEICRPTYDYLAFKDPKTPRRVSGMNEKGHHSVIQAAIGADKIDVPSDIVQSPQDARCDPLSAEFWSPEHRKWYSQVTQEHETVYPAVQGHPMIFKAPPYDHQQGGFASPEANTTNRRVSMPDRSPLLQQRRQQQQGHCAQQQFYSPGPSSPPLYHHRQQEDPFWKAHFGLHSSARTGGSDGMYQKK